MSFYSLSGIFKYIIKNLNVSDVLGFIKHLIKRVILFIYYFFFCGGGCSHVPERTLFWEKPYPKNRL